MITDEQAERANDFIRDNAREYAQVTAQREYLDEYLKIKEASLMEDVEGPEHERKSYARSHPDYLQIIEGRKAAREKELELKWKLVAAQTKIDMWRTMEASNRKGI